MDESAMIEPIVVTLFPVLFLIILFGGGALMRRKNIDIDGTPPIARGPFLTSKYLIVVVWAAVAAQSWGIDMTFLKAPEIVRWSSLCLWAAGFSLLFVGRLSLGNSFRIGSPREGTGLTANGLFRCSRNPMYLGVYTTMIAAVLYTLNPVILMIAVFVIAVHHWIVLAEESYLRNTFGPEYEEYCRRVRRYL
jgi:protein-S-isoprenylcysteine O-methyltransferase Ste14